MKKENIDSIAYGFETDRDCLMQSGGEVLNASLPTIDKKTNRLVYSSDGLFSEEIFGMSKYTRSSNIKDPQKRYRTFAHITTMPYLPPLLYTRNSSFISKILGTESAKVLEEIYRCNKFLILIKKTGAVSMTFMESLKRVESRGTIKPLNMDNTWVSNSEFYYYTVDVNKLISDKNTSKEPAMQMSLYLSNENLVLMTGIPAILHLMFQSTLLEDYKHIDSRLKRFIESQSSTKSAEKAIRQDSLTLERMKYFIDNNISKRALVRETFTILPAGIRDSKLVTDKTKVDSQREDRNPISTAYVDLINARDGFKAHFPLFFNVDELYAKPNDIVLLKKFPISERYMNCTRLFIDSLEKTQTEIVGVLKGKNGRMRKTTASKRIDCSGGAVIIPDPSLRIDEVRLPIKMLLEFLKVELRSKNEFKSLVNEIYKLCGVNADYKNLLPLEKILLSKNLTSQDILDTPKMFSLTDTDVIFKTDKISELKKSIITIIETILENKRVIVIRYPSLHRKNELGAKILISWGPNIGFHPLICDGYNADFDGDKASVYLIELPKAVREVDELLLPSRDLFSAQGEPMVIPTQDVIIGAYWITKDPDKNDTEPIEYATIEEAERDYIFGKLKHNKLISVPIPAYNQSEYLKNISIELTRIKNGVTYLRKTQVLAGLTAIDIRETEDTRVMTTTLGKILFNRCIPQDIGFVNRNVDKYQLECTERVTKKVMSRLFERIAHRKTNNETAYIADTVKDFGYKCATMCGLSMSILDTISFDKSKDIEEGRILATKIEERFKAKEITKEKADEEKIAMWSKIVDKINDKAMNLLDEDNAIYEMLYSGGRGSRSQVTQMIGVRGAMKDTNGNITVTPITSSLSDGLTNEQFFIGSSGSRSGIHDRAVRTRDTGSVTRKDGFGIEDVTVTVGDCGDTEGTLLTALVTSSGKEITLGERAVGRFVLEDILNASGEVVLKAGEYVTEELIEDINENYKQLRIRTILSCKAANGVCAKCHGESFINNTFPYIGYAVGNISAQTVNERGSQLTMRTFHTGGAAGETITEAVESLTKIKQTEEYNKRILETIKLSKDKTKEPGMTETHDESGAYIPLKIEDAKQKVIDFIKSYNITSIRSYTETGVLNGITYESYGIIDGGNIVKSRKVIQEEQQVIYLDSGIKMKDIYFETYGKRMLDFFRIVYSGDSSRPIMSIISFHDLLEENIYLVNNGNNPIVVKSNIMNMKELALTGKPLTSTAFQDINRVLTSMALNGAVDKLVNPKAGVLTGNKLTTGKAGAKVARMKMIERSSDIETYDKWLQKAEQADKKIKEDRDARVLSHLNFTWVAPEINTPKYEIIGNTDDLTHEFKFISEKEYGTFDSMSKELELPITYEEVQNDYVEDIEETEEVEDIFDGIIEDIEEPTNQQKEKSDKDASEEDDLISINWTKQ